MNWVKNILLLLGLLMAVPGFAQPKETTRILFILDVSQSMTTTWEGNTRMASAKRILGEIVDSLSRFPDVEMALRAYGHQYYHTLENCKDTKLEVGFKANNRVLIKNRLRDLRPNGITPIAYSLEQSEFDFPKEPDVKNVIILITDGEESCGGDPCAVSQALQRTGIILKPFVIGLGDIEHFKSQLECMGTYYDAKTPSDFKKIMTNIVKQVLNKTTTQVNLLDETGKPSETDVAMDFYNPLSKVAAYTYYHTINIRGNPDTITVDPINQYDLIVHTLPPVIKNQVEVEPNRHNTIEVPAAQGDLEISMNSGTSTAKINAIIRKVNDASTIHIQPANTKERFLTGVYDLEILTLPRIKIDSVTIRQDQTTTIQVPQPGLVALYSNYEVYGGIFMYQENGQLEKIYNLDNRILKETVALQPGNYVLIYRSRYKPTNDTVHKPIQVVSGESQTLHL